MINKKIFTKITGLIAMIFLSQSSCSSNSDGEKISEAQYCLDKAKTATDASVCISKVEGLTSTSSHSIRCSGKFIAEGFSSPSKILNAFTALGNSSNNIDLLMNLITFSSENEISKDFINSQKTFEYCYNSGSKGATLIASFSNISMAFYAFASGLTPIPAECPLAPTGSPLQYPFSTCLSAVIANCIESVGGGGYCTDFVEIINPSTSNGGAQSAQVAIGTTILASYKLSCSGGTAHSVLCSTLQTAVTDGGGASNPRGVGVSFLETLLGVP